MSALPAFPDFFRALWPYEPFPWQSMLAERVAEGAWPRALDLPTASGKTACIEAALYALAVQAERPTAERTAPRRIWFVVDRRIVVDEAFSRAKRIADALAAASDGPLREVADRLRRVAGTERPLAVARLRGGVLRDGGWARLPSQPAVITSTVDQVGSRLLFRGYGRSLLAAPIFAGLAANDSLILLDEAHCSVPFLQTLQSVERYRAPSWADAPVRSPFAFVVLSATPPEGIPEADVFPGAERHHALDHPVLRQRLAASKRAALVEVKPKRRSSSDPLIGEAVGRAESYLEDGKRRIAVMVNRVRTATGIASAVRARVDDGADVVLLTGRLRPFERDYLVERWTPFLRAVEPVDAPRPIILVSTQCLEVGADFSFDALVTEAASLDALRQRFGRLDRMGEAGSSSSSILVREGDADPKKGDPDPIYGNALGNAWKLLLDRSEEGMIDFGVEPLRANLEDVEDLSPYLAPAGEAPVLLPAHVDLLCQTAPPPEPQPSVEIYLHGKDRGTPEAQVVWRADLPLDDPESWVETVALCPPVTGEMLSVPLFRLRSFLAGAGAGEDSGDVEGVPQAAVNGAKRSRPFLLWRGRDRSGVARVPGRIAPGDIVVVPATYGIGELGQPPITEGVGLEGMDLWERVLKSAGKPAALRLHRSVLRRWLSCAPVQDLVDLVEGPALDRDELDDAIGRVLAYERVDEDAAYPPPEWWCDLLRTIRSRSRIEEHPAGGVILFSRTSAAAQGEAESDLFADDDDLTSASGWEEGVSLDEHCRLVERTAEKVARLCLGEEYLNTLGLAGRWHDAGKLDERFQILLHQGDELAATWAPAPLAKSASIPTSPVRRRAIREASGLPPAFRHEMLSTQLAQRFASLPDDENTADLFLHLVASHHGHGRPFAPVSLDEAPAAVEGRVGQAEIALSAVERGALPPSHRLDSGIPDRFWRLVRRHGWWGLAYLEAILRLSDWYASELAVSRAQEAREESAV